MASSVGVWVNGESALDSDRTESLNYDRQTQEP